MFVTERIWIKIGTELDYSLVCHMGCLLSQYYVPVEYFYVAYHAAAGKINKFLIMQKTKSKNYRSTKIRFPTLNEFRLVCRTANDVP